MTEPKRAAIYLRQSLDKTGERAAVQRQLVACQALCVAKGWEVHGDPYEDNDTSATSRKPRPAYQRLLADARAKNFDAIVVWHLDRLARNVRDLEDVLDIGLPIATAVGDMDLSTDMGRLVARILNAVAVGEVERKAARQKAGNQQRAALGVPHAAAPPFGYRREVQRSDSGKVLTATLIQEPTEAEAIRAGYKLVLAGATNRGIAADWNRRGLQTSAGQPWTGWSVRRRLINPVYAGLTSYNGEEVGAGNWEAIVSEDVWRAANEVLRDPKRRTTTDQTRRYLLPGLAFCGVDGCTLKVATGRSHRGVRTYVCQSKHLAVKADPIDEAVTRLVFGRLSKPDAAAVLLHDKRQPEGEALRDRAQALRAKLEATATRWGKDLITDAQFESLNTQLRAELADVESRLSYSGRADVLRDLVTADPAAVWEQLDLDRRRAVIDALVGITLLPPGRGKRTFDPRTVQLRWK